MANGKFVEVWLLLVDGNYAPDAYVFATEQELKEFLEAEYEYDFEDMGEYENVAAQWDPVLLPASALREVVL